MYTHLDKDKLVDRVMVHLGGSDPTYTPESGTHQRLRAALLKKLSREDLEHIDMILVLRKYKEEHV